MLPDGSNSKSPKIGQKRQNQWILGKFTPKSGDAFEFENKKGFFTSKWSTIVTVADVVLNSMTRWFKMKITKNCQILCETVNIVNLMSK